MVIDALPYPTMPNKLANKYPGKVFVHYYQQDKKSTGVVKWDGEQHLVKSDRTKIIDSVVSDINAKDIVYNLTSAELEQYIYHCEQMYRVIVETPQGIKKPAWKTIEGRPDHYFHATVYWRLALEQTLGQGGIITHERPGKKLGQPVVSEDGTVPALDLKEVAKKVARKQRYASKSYDPD
jgi:hypothetical protein